MNSEFGTIAHLNQSVGDELSLLQKELRRVTKIVTVLATSVGLLFFVLAIALAGVSLAESFVFAVVMIVAFVPEGMLPIPEQSSGLVAREDIDLAEHAHHQPEAAAEGGAAQILQPVLAGELLPVGSGPA
jgi:hypothetical protein